MRTVGLLEQLNVDSRMNAVSDADQLIAYLTGRLIK